MLDFTQEAQPTESTRGAPAWNAAEYSEAPTVGFAPVPPQGKPWKSKPLITVGAVAAVVVIAGVLAATLGRSSGSSFATDVPQTFTVTGEYTINDTYGYSCATDYPDISAGREVDISGPNGQVIAFGNLSGEGCSYTFTVPNVPAGQSIYGVTASHRGTVHYTETQLRGGISLTLGK